MHLTTKQLSTAVLSCLVVRSFTSRLEVPKRASEPRASEHSLRLRRRKPLPASVEPLTMPRLRQRPQLLRREHRAAIQSAHLAPPVHMLFRPEDKHRASSKDDVLPPARGRHGEMHDRIGGRERTAANGERKRRVAIGAHRIDVAIPSEHSNHT